METLESLRLHFSEKGNQFASELFVVKWNGHTPRISTSYLYLLKEDGFLKTIVAEIKTRKSGRDVGDVNVVTSEAYN